MHNKVDAVITAYNEDIEHVNLTLKGCLDQTTPFNKIFLIDDGSKFPLDEKKLIKNSKIQYIKLGENKGISGARNTAINISDADFIACLNIDIVLDKDWLLRTSEFLCQNNHIGCVFGKLETYKKNILSSWRMRFHEIRFDVPSGISHFAPGHAVLFRRDLLLKVGGYNEKLRLIMEDSDICERLSLIGYPTYFLNNISSVSYQDNSLFLLGKKHVVRVGGEGVYKYSYLNFFTKFSKDLFQRVGRNVYKGRLVFLPIDFCVYLLNFYFFIKRK